MTVDALTVTRANRRADGMARAEGREPMRYGAPSFCLLCEETHGEECAELERLAPSGDAIYYWHGGRVVGKWREAIAGLWTEYLSTDELVARLERAGYVTVRGSRSVGPPDGAPAEARFVALGV